MKRSSEPEDHAPVIYPFPLMYAEYGIALFFDMSESVGLTYMVFQASVYTETVPPLLIRTPLLVELPPHPIYVAVVDDTVAYPAPTIFAIDVCI